MIISFCCNDYRNGNFTGTVEAIQFHGNQFNAPGSNAFTVDTLNRRVKVSRRWFKICDYTRWYGNWCWDSSSMTKDETARLVNYLHKLGWTWEEIATDLIPFWEQEKVTAEKLIELYGQ